MSGNTAFRAAKQAQANQRMLAELERQRAQAGELGYPPVVEVEGSEPPLEEGVAGYPYPIKGEMTAAPDTLQMKLGRHLPDLPLLPLPGMPTIREAALWGRKGVPEAKMTQESPDEPVRSDRSFKDFLLRPVKGAAEMVFSPFVEASDRVATGEAKYLDTSSETPLLWNVTPEGAELGFTALDILPGYGSVLGRGARHALKVPGEIAEDLGTRAALGSPTILPRYRKGADRAGAMVAPSNLPKDAVPLTRKGLAPYSLDEDMERAMTQHSYRRPATETKVGVEIPGKIDEAIIETKRARSDASAEMKALGDKEFMTDEEIRRRQEWREKLKQEPSQVPDANAPYEDWIAWGDANNVNLRVRDPVKIGTRADGSEITLPGGLDGKFRLSEMFAAKADNFDPNELDPETHVKLMEKLLRTFDNPNMDEVDIFNGLNFGILSPKNGLVSNEFMTARTRIRNMDELRELASEYGTEAGTDAARRERYALVGATHGGLGATGTPDLANQAELAYLVLNKPEMFRPQKGETLRDVAYRLSNTVRGMGEKVSQLSVPILDMKNANTAAVDLQMIKDTWREMVNGSDPVDAQFRAKLSEVTGIPEEDILRLSQQSEPPSNTSAARTPDGKKWWKLQSASVKLIQSPLGGGRKVYRNAEGELVGGKDPRVSPDKILGEPKLVRGTNPFYERSLQLIDQSSKNGLPLFSNQHRKWDLKRQRFEPHEIWHPDWRKLPRQSFEQMRQALEEHRRLGYTQKKGLLKAKSDWRKLWYGNADVDLLKYLAAGGVGALGAASMLGGEER